MGTARGRSGGLYILIHRRSRLAQESFGGTSVGGAQGASALGHAQAAVSKLHSAPSGWPKLSPGLRAMQKDWLSSVPYHN
jgi:hypothetical protein